MISETNYADHVQESMKLEAIGYAHLFSIRIRPPSQADIFLYFSPKRPVTWQGKNWEDFTCNLVGVKQNSSGEVARPKFTVANPEGVFTQYAHEGWLDGAEITRWRVLTTHLANNTNSFVRQTWRVSKVLAATKSNVSCELRGSLDGQFFLLPARSFRPPEFPHVSL